MGQTDEVLATLMKTQNLPQSTQQATLLLQASWQHLEQQTLGGTLSFEETDRMRSRINMGVLSVVDDIERGGKGKMINLGALQSDFLNTDTQRIITEIKAKNVNTAQVSDIKIGAAENVVIGSGNTVTTNVRKGWGRLQFGLIAIVLLAVLWFGWQAFGDLKSDNDATFSSLSTIERQISELAKKDATVATAMKANGNELQKTLEEGFSAYENADLQVASWKLKEVADVAPSPALLLNLATIYDKLGENRDANTYFEKAFKASPELKRTHIAGLKGQRLNLIHAKNGGRLISSTNKVFEYLLNENPTWASPNEEAVFGFGNDGTAIFDEVGFEVTATEDINIKNADLYSATSPRGPFKLIKRVTVENMYLAETPFQMFKFAPVSAKYIKIKVIDGYGNYMHINAIRVMGALQ